MGYRVHTEPSSPDTRRGEKARGDGIHSLTPTAHSSLALDSHLLDLSAPRSPGRLQRVASLQPQLDLTGTDALDLASPRPPVRPTAAARARFPPHLVAYISPRLLSLCSSPPQPSPCHVLHLAAAQAPTGSHSRRAASLRAGQATGEPFEAGTHPRPASGFGRSDQAAEGAERDDEECAGFQCGSW